MTAPGCISFTSAADTNTEFVVATCEYGEDVTAMVERGSCWATQFHRKNRANWDVSSLVTSVDRLHLMSLTSTRLSIYEMGNVSV